MSIDRAMMATWEETPPLTVAKPMTLARSICAVSEGVSSLATRIVFSFRSGFSTSWPVISPSTRVPTSRTSVARPARTSLSSEASCSARSV